jgi:hypothetical protein
VRGQEDRDVLGLLELADVAPDRAARLRVQADRRLVEEQDPRRVQQPARDLEATLHAAREGRHSAAPALPEADHLEDLAHPVGDRRARDAVQLGVQAQVLLRGEVAVERRVLEDEADVPAHLVALGRDVVAGDGGAAAGRPHEGAQHADRRRLAGPIGPEEAERLPRGDVEVDAADRLDVAVALHEPAHAHGRRPRRDRRRLAPFGDRHARASSAVSPSARIR